MIRLAGLALAAAIAAAAGSGASPASENGKADPGKQPAHAADQSAELKDVLVKLDRNDLAGAQAALKAIVAAPKFKARPEREQYVFRMLYGRTLLAAKQPQEALVQLRLATAFPEADVDTWGPRLDADAALADNKDALASLTMIASRWPKSLAGFSDRYIMQLAFEMRADEHLSDARFGLLQALRQAGWSPRDPFDTADPLWRDLALGLLDRGQAQAAGAAAADIVAPETVLDMLIDRRFDAITTAAADRYDLGKVAARRLAALRAASAAAPDKLKGFNAVANALLDEGRPGEALALIDDAIKRARPADGAHSTFTDLDELNWAYDLRSRALLLLGRGDEALASMKTGAEWTENGQSNVSQQLNLGELYVHLDRPAEGLDAIKTVSPDKVSRYGRMDREGVRAEAFAQLHDRAGLAASLAYMKAHADEAPAWLIEVSIEAGDTEGAAQTTIRMLADPIQRPQALELLQDTILPDTAPAYLKRFHQAMVALRERPDVKAAIDRVGRVMVAPLVTNEL